MHGRKSMIKVLPSSNPEKEDNLLNYARELEGLGVEYLHCDVMDGQFVENKCLSFDVLKNVRDNCNILLDVHLMVKDVFANVQKYITLKPNFITVHYEALKNVSELKKLSTYVRSKDVLFGVSIKPNTSVSVLANVKEYIDLVLIMSVEPGKSGQSFIVDSLGKIKDAKALFEGTLTKIEVDGGINLDNYSDVVESGAEFLVMGNAFYKSTDRKKLLKKIDKHY